MCHTPFSGDESGGVVPPFSATQTAQLHAIMHEELVKVIPEIVEAVVEKILPKLAGNPDEDDA